MRNTQLLPAVTGSMSTLRAAMPFVRALILAGVVTLLIMVVLPALFAIAAASSR
jgi:hypothetical protein